MRRTKRQEQRDVSVGLYSGRIVLLGKQTPALCFPTGPESVRLADGPGRCQGRVEVKFQGEWSSVCQAGWSFAAAKVVCRQLGCGRATLTRRGCNKATQGQGAIWQRKASCSGQEVSLQDCLSEVWEHNCTHNEDVWVECEGNAYESRGRFSHEFRSIGFAFTKAHGEPVIHQMTVTKLLSCAAHQFSCF